MILEFTKRDDNGQDIELLTVDDETNEGRLIRLKHTNLKTMSEDVKFYNNNLNIKKDILELIKDQGYCLEAIKWMLKQYLTTI